MAFAEQANLVCNLLPVVGRVHFISCIQVATRRKVLPGRQDLHEWHLGKKVVTNAATAPNAGIPVVLIGNEG